MTRVIDLRSYDEGHANKVLALRSYEKGHWTKVMSSIFNFLIFYTYNF